MGSTAPGTRTSRVGRVPKTTGGTLSVDDHDTVIGSRALGIAITFVSVAGLAGFAVKFQILVPSVPTITRLVASISQIPFEDPVLRLKGRLGW